MSKETMREAARMAAPVLAFCGFSGAGKTTLLELVLPYLVRRGLRVAVVKHDAHGFEVDRPGKDSDRFFRAGATVLLAGPSGQFERRHHGEALWTTLSRLSLEHDLVLVEGHKGTTLEKIWLCSEGETAAPADVNGVLRVLPRGESARQAALLEFIEEWLPRRWRERPVLGGLLVGGASRRMGSAKQLLDFGGRTLGEIASAALAAEGVSEVLVLGAGEVPERLRDLHRLPDVRGLGGPAAGMLAAHRWAPEAAWIFGACDHPRLRGEHVRWLLAQRRPGCWAVVPRQADGHPCPTLALYEPQALRALESLVSEGRGSPAALLEQVPTALVEPPPALRDGWTSVNTPEEFAAECRSLEPLR